MTSKPRSSFRKDGKYKKTIGRYLQHTFLVCPHKIAKFQGMESVRERRYLVKLNDPARIPAVSCQAWNLVKQD